VPNQLLPAVCAQKLECMLGSDIFQAPPEVARFQVLSPVDSSKRCCVQLGEDFLEIKRETTWGIQSVEARLPEWHAWLLQGHPLPLNLMCSAIQPLLVYLDYRSSFNWQYQYHTDVVANILKPPYKVGHNTWPKSYPKQAMSWHLLSDCCKYLCINMTDFISELPKKWVHSHQRCLWNPYSKQQSPEDWEAWTQI
jgi:hypothetical protein